MYVGGRFKSNSTNFAAPLQSNTDTTKFTPDRNSNY